MKLPGGGGNTDKFLALGCVIRAEQSWPQVCGEPWKTNPEFLIF